MLQFLKIGGTLEHRERKKKRKRKSFCGVCILWSRRRRIIILWPWKWTKLSSWVKSESSFGISFTESDREREENSQKTEKLEHAKIREKEALICKQSFTVRRREVRLSTAKNKKLGTGNFYEVALLLHVCACKC